MIAAGVLIFSLTTKRFLFLLRNNTKTKNTWGMPGGKIHANESVIDGLHREIFEELGEIPQVIKTIPLETFTSFDEEFQYFSFIFIVNNEFIPILNDEHGGYAWAAIDRFPKPLHPGLFKSLSINKIREKIALIEESYNK
jgi:8-oxo-dGTP pyrophosphatase MutT (NUDIX family)